jgi:serine/threonine-protein kinase HipA
MAQLGYYDGDEGASYLELAEFLINNGAKTKSDLSQLWRRIVFNIAVSNTDDHLRNHGFLFTKKGWVLSPAYDMNPVIHSTGLHLNIDQHDNSLSFDLAFKVIPYFQLNQLDADKIYKEVLESVKNWTIEANKIGISRNEQKLMANAFRL